MRVLVIDDEPDVLLLCRVNFEIAGHEVIVAADGECGLELAATGQPDLIVLDVMLPRRDGLSILHDLATDPNTSRTPVVLLTARARAEDRLRGWEAGCAEYVTKPFSPAQLADLVTEVHGQSQDERRARRDRALAELSAVG